MTQPDSPPPPGSYELSRFIDGYCAVAGVHRMRAGAFADAFHTWAAKYGYKDLTNTQIRAEMHRRGFEYKRTAEERVYIGIHLVDTP